MAEQSTWSIRQATLDDIDDLVRLRLAMMADLPGRDPSAEPDVDSPLAEANRGYLRKAMPAGEFVAYVVESGGIIVATSGLRLYSMAPHDGNIRGINAYILNMYTVPAWRGRGLASALLDRLVEHAREAGATGVSLRASDAGRPVYERYGFTSDASYMSFRITDDTQGRAGE